MSKRLRAAVFAAGAVLFIYLIAHIGLRQLAADARAVGWMMVPIVLVWGVVYLLSTAGWRFTMDGEARRPAFWPTWTMLTSSFALNFVTPFVNVGGEPFKAAALSGWLPPRRAATSVMLHWLLRTLGQMLFWLTALIVALVTYAHGALEITVLLGAMAGVSGLVLLLWTVHRSGGLEATVRILGKLPVLNRLARALAARRDTIVEMDRQIVEFYHASPGRFFRAVGCEYLARLVSACEYYFIFVALGLAAGYREALLVSGLQ
jgi:Lysylphosphatidylglycerol synthase TM region